MPAQATTPSGILTRLRTETRAEHAAIERLLDFTSEALSLADYRRWLERLHGFHRPVEARLGELPGLELGARRKTSWLAADLVALGAHDLAALAECSELPPLSTAADRFGCIYVLEGATLGGRVISRHVGRTLAVTSQSGGRFFHGYGSHTTAMWKAFQAALTAFACTPEVHDRVVAAAVSTFRTLARWCEGARIA